MGIGSGGGVFRRLVALVARSVGRLVPDRYEGRLDRLSRDDQHTVIGNNFRGGM